MGQEADTLLLLLCEGCQPGALPCGRLGPDQNPQLAPAGLCVSSAAS